MSHLNLNILRQKINHRREIGTDFNRICQFIPGEGQVLNFLDSTVSCNHNSEYMVE